MMPIPGGKGVIQNAEMSLIDFVETAIDACASPIEVLSRRADRDQNGG
jgi:hypothetical protein